MIALIFYSKNGIRYHKKSQIILNFDQNNLKNSTKTVSPHNHNKG